MTNAEAHPNLETYIKRKPHKRVVGVAGRSQNELMPRDQEPIKHMMAMRYSGPIKNPTSPKPLTAGCLHLSETPNELLAAERVARSRPEPLRDYDQISMRAGDLLRQAKLMLPSLKGKRVAFVGDNDGASLMLGLLGMLNGDMPEHMTLLDFDRRILASAANMAHEAGFADQLETRPYNVFDPVPADLVDSFDVFYTNPPYGKKNSGASGQLFITRGVELCHPRGGACGCIILPDDDERPWTAQAMHSTQKFLVEHGWIVRDKISQMHQYHLLKDPGLASSTVWVRDVFAGVGFTKMPYVGKRVSQAEIEHFYGEKVKPPYAHYILENGERDYDWTNGETMDD